MDREWTDTDIYKRYELTDEEIEYVESQIKPMGATDVVEGAEADDEDLP